eukprot:7044413-Lingulodinium_polyedra.AAC.1
MAGRRDGPLAGPPGAKTKKTTAPFHYASRANATARRRRGAGCGNVPPDAHRLRAADVARC